MALRIEKKEKEIRDGSAEKGDTASRFTHIDSIECTSPRPVWGCCLTSMEHRIPGHKLFPKQNFRLSYLTWSLWLVGRLQNMKNTYEFIEIERVELQSCACAHFEAFFMLIISKMFNNSYRSQEIEKSVKIAKKSIRLLKSQVEFDMPAHTWYIFSQCHHPNCSASLAICPLYI